MFIGLKSTKSAKVLLKAGLDGQVGIECSQIFSKINDESIKHACLIKIFTSRI